MAVYGTEDYHLAVRTNVCDFIHFRIIPNYSSLSDIAKYDLMLQFDFVAEMPWTNEEFQANAQKYLETMRKPKVCGRNIELLVACYIFCLEVMLIQKQITWHNTEQSRTYSRSNVYKGHALAIEGMQKDDIGSKFEATPGRASAIQSIVMMFIEFYHVKGASEHIRTRRNHTSSKFFSQSWH